MRPVYRKGNKRVCLITKPLDLFDEEYPFVVQKKVKFFNFWYTTDTRFKKNTLYEKYL